MNVLKILAVMALLGSLGWFATTPSFEPGLAIIGSVSGLLSLFIIERRKKDRRTPQTQSVTGSALGIQAGGDVTVGNISATPPREPRSAK